MRRIVATALAGIAAASMLCAPAWADPVAAGDASAVRDASAAADQSSASDDALTSEAWVGIYDGGKITFEPDGSMSWGLSTGSWSRGDDVVLVEFSTPGGDFMERSFDVVEADGGAFLRSRKSGRINDSDVTFVVVEYYPETVAKEMLAELAKTPGETVSTDIIDLTVDSAELCFYASGAKDQTWLTPLAESDGGVFKTNKGRTFVALTFTVTNNDRDTLDIGGLFGKDWFMNWVVVYNGDGFNVSSHDLRMSDKDGAVPVLCFTWSAVSADGGATFRRYNSENYLLHAGETVTIRTLGLVVMEPESPGDAFDLVVNVPRSDGEYDKFIYSVGRREATAQATPTAAEPAPADDYSPIQIGDSGEGVAAVQERLIELGYLGAAADGDFGPVTEAAVAAFQQAGGLEATGVVDRATHDLLFADA